MRELNTTGVKTPVGIYFKIDSSELVYAGKYGENHKRITLGQAISNIMVLEDPLGYELIIDRKIESKDILRINNFLKR